MELTTVWFVLIAVLWIGYFVLEGFDFGVGDPAAGARQATRPSAAS
jgi:cytochrome bd-type quinol oxidase subunit 2